jgi:nitroimidazol reductase NimA-like FMN-containing flavoprotein (pyridoxamine 5'-phosphate oxidase superfamily)
MEPVTTRMTRPACLDFLRARTVGRIAITHEAMPAIIPVNYTLLDGRILVRTAETTTLARGCDGAVVAFEVDDLQADGAGGASVLVVGLAEHLPAWAVRELEGVEPVSAMGPGRDVLIAIPLRRVSGRRVGSYSRTA